MQYSNPLPLGETSEVLSQIVILVWCWKRSSQPRASESQAFAVKSLVVEGSIFPTAKDDTNPFVGKGAQSGMMRFATLLLLVVVSLRPLRSRNRLTCKLMKALPQELGTGHTPVNPAGLATLFSDWSNTGELLDLGSEFKAVTVRTESGEQTWSQSGSGARKLPNRVESSCFLNSAAIC